MTIDITDFNTHLPALRTPGGEVFEKMQDALHAACLDLEPYETYCAEDGGLPALLTRHACVTAAWEAVPALDLVATPTGFGIVSNQNTAPASKERVAALREKLRRDKTLSWESLVTALMEKTTWRDTAACRDLVFCNLLYLPCLMRRHGVVAEGGGEVYEEERAALTTSLALAADYLESIVSPALHERLSLLQRDEKNMTPAEFALINRSRQLLCARIMRRPPRDIHRLTRSLLDVLRRCADEFPEYTSSAECAAQAAMPYSNSREHPTFFFG